MGQNNGNVLLYLLNKVIESYADYYRTTIKVEALLLLKAVPNQKKKKNGYFFNVSRMIFTVRNVIISCIDFRRMHKNLNVYSFTVYLEDLEPQRNLDVCCKIALYYITCFYMLRNR